MAPPSSSPSASPVPLRVSRTPLATSVGAITLSTDHTTSYQVEAFSVDTDQDKSKSPSPSANRQDSLSPDIEMVDTPSSGPSSTGATGNQVSVNRNHLPTGLCYDARMRFHLDENTNGGKRDRHPEDPRRIEAIMQKLECAGLVARHGQVHRPDKLQRIPARQATRDEICAVHSPEHYAFVKTTAELPQEELEEIGNEGDSVYYNSQTFLAATLSVGAAIECCKAVMDGEVKNAMAVIRPPGHHAVPDEAQGFCLFNNVSVAARACQSAYPHSCRRILIFDWDVHHGNGTQDAFYDDPNILYMSIHVHQNGHFYPLGPKGDHLHCGAGDGLGYNVNVPWTEKKMDDADYMYAFQKVIMPVALDFNPDLVIISAGFDAAAGDVLGDCNVTPECYSHMTHGLMSLAGGRVVACLEGGYNLESISMSALAVTRTLMGEPPDRLKLGLRSSVAEVDVHRVIEEQSKHWPCFYNLGPPLVPKGPYVNRLNDVIQLYRINHLYDEHKMVPLAVLRDQLLPVFQEQILATSLFEEAETLIVFVHDPPELHGHPDDTTKKIPLHKAWLADALKDYVQWTASSGYAVMDINVPKTLGALEDSKTVDSKEKLKALTNELMIYVWENYIQVSDVKKVLLVGIGQAHHAIVNLLGARGKSSLLLPCAHPNWIPPPDCLPLLKGVLMFVANEPLQSLPEDTEPRTRQWYTKSSMIFVGYTHPIWPQEGKPSRERYGRVSQSPFVDIDDLLLEHTEVAREFMQRKVGLGPRAALQHETEPVTGGHSGAVGGGGGVEKGLVEPGV
ncbi:MAG: Histone deacetylase hda1 [Caeruleum heppii]|nr:MAG: Histone deacetylase hda1 [Caeruleum heppii]